MNDPRLTTIRGNPIPEDNYAAFAWLFLMLAITLFVVAFDVWATISHHKLMTTQFRLWLFDPVIGPFIAGGWVGIFTGLTYHWFLRGR